MSRKPKPPAAKEQPAWRAIAWLAPIVLAMLVCWFSNQPRPAVVPMPSKAAAATSATATAAASSATSASEEPPRGAIVEDSACGLTRTITNAADLLGETFTERVNALIDRSARAEPGQSRVWQNGNHMVRFLQYFAKRHDSRLVDDLWNLTRQADRWGLTGSASAPRLALRCLEVIDYHADRDHVLGFHNDGDT